MRQQKGRSKPPNRFFEVNKGVEGTLKSTASGGRVSGGRMLESDWYKYSNSMMDDLSAFETTGGPRTYFMPRCRPTTDPGKSRRTQEVCKAICITDCSGMMFGAEKWTPREARALFCTVTTKSCGALSLSQLVHVLQFFLGSIPQALGILSPETGSVARTDEIAMLAIFTLPLFLKYA